MDTTSPHNHAEQLVEMIADADRRLQQVTAQINQLDAGYLTERNRLRDAHETATRLLDSLRHAHAELTGTKPPSSAPLPAPPPAGAQPSVLAAIRAIIQTGEPGSAITASELTDRFADPGDRVSAANRVSAALSKLVRDPTIPLRRTGRGVYTITAMDPDHTTQVADAIRTSPPADATSIAAKIGAPIDTTRTALETLETLGEASQTADGWVATGQLRLVQPAH